MLSLQLYRENTIFFLLPALAHAVIADTPPLLPIQNGVISASTMPLKMPDTVLLYISSIVAK